MEWQQLEIDFGGATYDPERDRERLGAQLRRVFDVMADGQWRSLYEIAELTGDPPQSISARLRDLRKPRFGEYEVERRNVSGGTFEYRVLDPSKTHEPQEQQNGHH